MRSRPFSRRARLAVLLAATVAVGLVLSGRGIYRKLTGQPRTAAQARSVVWGYLEEKTGRDEFPDRLPALTNSEPGTVVKTNAADKQRVKLRKRERSDRRLELTRGFRREMAAAMDYPTMYRLIGEELATAEKLLTSGETPQQETGLLLAMDASQAAQQEACDGWLGARICEAYLWPFVESVGNSPEGRLDLEKFLRFAEKTFRQTEETESMIRNYRLLIRTAPGSSRAAGARYRLARLLEDQQDYAGALKCLREIVNTNNAALQERVALLEQRLRSRR